MSPLVLVMVGGGLGSGARYLLSTYVLERMGSTMPWGTLLVNVLGSLVMGALIGLAAGGRGPSMELRLFLTTGFLGGFTTYSAFNQETLGLLGAGDLRAALLYLGLTLGLCLLAGGAGLGLVRALVGAPLSP